MVYQLMKGTTPEEIKEAGAGAYFADHDSWVYPNSVAGVPFTAVYIQPEGDPITVLHENLAAEQKAWATYENLIKLVDDPEVIGPLKFLREREVVHFQGFGEALMKVHEYLDSKKFF